MKNPPSYEAARANRELDMERRAQLNEAWLWSDTPDDTPQNIKDRNFERNMRRMTHGFSAMLTNNKNKCCYYSVLNSDMEKLTNRFRLGLYRRIECLACILYSNGPDRLHAFFVHLLTLERFPYDMIPFVFIEHCLKSLSGSVYSTSSARRQSDTYWTKPHLKAELAYGLRILLSIIEEVNDGTLSKTGAEVKAKEIVLCNGEKMNELFAMAVLQGLIVPRIFLLQPTITGRLCQSIRKKLFENDSDMTNTRIQSCIKQAANKSGCNLLAAEYALQGWVGFAATADDMLVFDQSFVWMPISKVAEDGIIHLHSADGIRSERTEKTDRMNYQQIKRDNGYGVYFHWWRSTPNKSDCVLDYVADCKKFNDWLAFRHGQAHDDDYLSPTQMLAPAVSRRLDAKTEKKYWRKFINKKSNNIDFGRICIPMYRTELLQSDSSSTELIDSDKEYDVQPEEELEEQRMKFLYSAESMQATRGNVASIADDLYENDALALVSNEMNVEKKNSANKDET
jgi:hypothetical protein